MNSYVTLAFFILVLSTTVEINATREYDSLPFILGAVRSVRDFEQVIKDNPRISLISFNVYRSSVDWDCGVVITPDYNDNRVNGNTLYGYSTSNFTTTIYAFKSFNLICSNVVMIEYQILPYPEDPVQSPVASESLSPEKLVLIIAGPFFVIGSLYFLLFFVIKVVKYFRTKEVCAAPVAQNVPEKK